MGPNYSCCFSVATDTPVKLRINTGYGVNVVRLADEHFDSTPFGHSSVSSIRAPLAVLAMQNSCADDDAIIIGFLLIFQHFSVYVRSNYQKMFSYELFDPPVPAGLPTRAPEIGAADNL